MIIMGVCGVTCSYLTYSPIGPGHCHSVGSQGNVCYDQATSGGRHKHSPREMTSDGMYIVTYATKRAVIYQNKLDTIFCPEDHLLG